MGNAVVLDHSIDGEGRAALTLTPATVITIYNKGPALQAITYVVAIAAAFEWKG